MNVFANLTERSLRNEGFLIGEGRLLFERIMRSSLRVIGMLVSSSCKEDALRLIYESPGVQKEELLSVLDIRQEDEIALITGFRFHRGMLIAAERPTVKQMTAWLEENKRAGADRQKRLLILPDITDPGNMGALLRSAAAFGWDAAVTGQESCDPFARKALRASMGAALTLPLLAAVPEDMNILSDKGFFCAAAELRENAVYIEDTIPFITYQSIALILGNEYSGIPEQWRCRGCCSVAIPLEDNIDSLNVAVAGSILMREWRIKRYT